MATPYRLGTGRRIDDYSSGELARLANVWQQFAFTARRHGDPIRARTLARLAGRARAIIAKRRKEAAHFQTFLNKREGESP